jgi:hypothetical protein
MCRSDISSHGAHGGAPRGRLAQNPRTGARRGEQGLPILAPEVREGRELARKTLQSMTGESARPMTSPADVQSGTPGEPAVRNPRTGLACLARATRCGATRPPLSDRANRVVGTRASAQKAAPAAGQACPICRGAFGVLPRALAEPAACRPDRGVTVSSCVRTFGHNVLRAEGGESWLSWRTGATVFCSGVHDGNWDPA